MLKSFSTQLVATAFFGPIGLAYTSMATAVLFTLILAVLYFTGFGALAILAIWPISIATGVLYVKFHNDRIRHSGHSLLLGPGHDDGLVSAVGSWVRGVGVLALVCGVGYFAYALLPPGGDPSVPGRIVNASSNPEKLTDAAGDNEFSRIQDNENVLLSGQDSNNVPVITLPNRDIPKVIVESSGNSVPTVISQAGVGESGIGDNNGISSQPVLYVDREVVNLRQGPGTEYPVVTQLDRNATIYEYARDGEWINIETEAGSFAGWIHGNLVRR